MIGLTLVDVRQQQTNEVLPQLMFSAIGAYHCQEIELT